MTLLLTAVLVAAFILSPLFRQALLAAAILLVLMTLVFFIAMATAAEQPLTMDDIRRGLESAAFVEAAPQRPYCPRGYKLRREYGLCALTRCHGEQL
jgi:hypothetical protein